MGPAPGDEVELVGAPDAGDANRIRARQLNWNGNTYRIRTTDGTPVWAGAAREGWGSYAGAWGGSDPEEISGEISGVEPASPGGSDMGRGVVLRLRTRDQDGEGERVRSRETRRVHLGPYWYVEENAPGLRMGQRVTVRGVTADVGGEQVTMAAELSRGSERVRLRSREGMPEWAGGWQNWDGWGPGSSYNALHRDGRATDAVGTVERVAHVAPMEGMGEGVSLTVRTAERRRLRAHLGPVWFAEQAELSISPGDTVSLRGSVVGLNGRSVMMVDHIECGNRRLRLRDRNGAPVWSGQVSEESEISEPVS
jgi:hypothetical protein